MTGPDQISLVDTPVPIHEFYMQSLWLTWAQHSNGKDPDKQFHLNIFVCMKNIEQAILLAFSDVQHKELSLVCQLLG